MRKNTSQLQISNRRRRRSSRIQLKKGTVGKTLNLRSPLRARTQKISRSPPTLQLAASTSQQRLNLAWLNQAAYSAPSQIYPRTTHLALIFLDKIRQDRERSTRRRPTSYPSNYLSIYSFPRLASLHQSSASISVWHMRLLQVYGRSIYLVDSITKDGGRRETGRERKEEQDLSHPNGIL